MRLSSPVVWSFVASLVCLGAIAEPAGVLEVDLVFPRNETYEPTPYMPVVFGFRNGELARRLVPDILITILNTADLGNPEGYIETPVTVNWTSNEPNFVYTIFPNTFATEGSWTIIWDLGWTSCKVEDDGLIHGDIVGKHTTRLSSFVMKKGGKPVDLVAITANNKTCTETLGVALNVTNTTAYISPHNRPQTFLSSDSKLETCVLVATSTPTPTTNPCLIKIDSSAKAKQCILDPTPDCPDRREENAAQQLAVAGATCFAVAFGAKVPCTTLDIVVV
ncbi:hypothetical protein C7999DRAFT_42179 [Corynascus novoguineensis]|uniref:DUF7136 domain-containing protein n=1 Tax=Corynascus novoguineensis TaxID=1126955 RepID=A0AAN7HI36_9PEZI|nr:hypothetical protein C7999DRAFT_42179 [Corynascus novoguineensis]